MNKTRSQSYFFFIQQVEMNKSLLIAIIFFIFVNTCFKVDALYLTGECPTNPYPVVQNFNLERYLGTWYMIERYDNWWQEGLDCNTYLYTQNPNKSITTFVEARILWNEIKYTPLTGIAYVSDPNRVPQEGRWNLSYYGAPTDRVNYHVLSTDYDNYSVVWNCYTINETVKDGKRSIEYIFGLETV